MRSLPECLLHSVNEMESLRLQNDKKNTTEVSKTWYILYDVLYMLYSKSTEIV